VTSARGGDGFPRSGTPSHPVLPFVSGDRFAGGWRGALALLIVALASSVDAAAAGDAKAGRAKALVCQACHGIDGLSKVPDAPNIAGQVEDYLVTQLQAFKSGARRSETMSVVASTLSDEDVRNLAAYFSAIEIKVGRIPGE
jgi:cytochrome c553